MSINAENWTPIEYRSTQQASISIQYRGNGKWSINRNGLVYSKSGKGFEYEPLPSNRSEKWLDDHRFNSAEEAIAVIENGE